MFTRIADRLRARRLRRQRKKDLERWIAAARRDIARANPDLRKRGRQIAKDERSGT